MQQTTLSSPQRDRNGIPGDVYSERGAAGVAGIWLAFYAIIGVAFMAAGVTANVASLAAID